MASVTTCPTCSQVVNADTEGLIQARIASRPDSGPAQARHITRLQTELTQANAWINAKCTISGCWRSKYEELVQQLNK